MSEVCSIVCPKCTSLLGIDESEIDTRLKCDCGFEFIVDSHGVATEVDYSAIPASIACYLTEEEKQDRLATYTRHFSRLTMGADLVDGASVDQMLDLRVKQVKINRIKSFPKNCGCLMLALLPLVALVFWACSSQAWIVLLWPGLMALVPLLGLVSEFREAMHTSKLDESTVRAARDNENLRLLDNVKAKDRWKARMIKEEFLRAEAERVSRERLLLEEKRLREEQARIAEIKRLQEQALRNDQGMVDAILKGVEKFDIFVKELKKGDGHGYEDRICRFFDLCGFKCERPSRSSDQGVDVILTMNGERMAIQCKYFSDSSVGNDAVQAVFAGKTYYKCVKAAVITNSKFTKSAKELAKTTGVELIHHNSIYSFLGFSTPPEFTQYLSGCKDRNRIVVKPTKAVSRILKRFNKKRKSVIPPGALVTLSEGIGDNGKV